MIVLIKEMNWINLEEHLMIYFVFGGVLNYNNCEAIQYLENIQYESNTFELVVKIKTTSKAMKYI